MRRNTASGQSYDRRMTRRILIGLFTATLCASSVAAQRGTAPKSSLVERVGDTGFIQLQAPSFAQLDDRRKALAYWLTQASIAIDPIIYDQLSRFGLRQKRILEGIVAHRAVVPAATFPKLRSFALLFWANRGNHNEITGQKLIPTFTFEELQEAALKTQAAGAFSTPSGDLTPLASTDAVKKELGELRQAFFDPEFEPITTAKTPPPGNDILEQLLRKRHARRLEDLSGSVSIELARRERCARHSRRGLSRGYVGWTRAARTLCRLPAQGHRLSRARKELRRSHAGDSYFRSDSLL